MKSESGGYCVAHNLTGWPAAVVRAGTSPEGLPIGVHIAAKPWRNVALAVAGVIEKDSAAGNLQRIFNWHPRESADCQQSHPTVAYPPFVFPSSTGEADTQFP